MYNFFLKITKSRSIRGFTLQEILLSVALVAIIAGMSLPMYRTFITRDDLDTAVTSFAYASRRAQALSFSSDGDTGWGVHVGVGGILLFKGASYVGRDASFDEVTSIPTTITISGLTDITFAKVTGEPYATGTVSFTSQDNETRTATINEKGTIDY